VDFVGDNAPCVRSVISYTTYDLIRSFDIWWWLTFWATLYVDGLLKALNAAGTGCGCHMGHMFVGALAYAYDIALISV